MYMLHYSSFLKQYLLNVLNLSDLYQSCSLHAFSSSHEENRPPLWSVDQSSWPHTLRFRVRFSALPDFLSSIESETGSTEPREDK
jgi:hypothetical protein